MQEEKIIKQPIPPLPSWEVAAFIFSFYGYTHDVINLLQYLSRDTRDYYRSYHRPILKGFLRDFIKPEQVVPTSMSYKCPNHMRWQQAIADAWNEPG